LDINFKKMTYKEFYSIVNKITISSFKTELTIHNTNNKELYVRLKWYCSFIYFIIKQNHVLRISDFKSVVVNNKYLEQDANMIIQVFNSIYSVLNDIYSHVTIMDISNFCDKIESDIKI